MPTNYTGSGRPRRVHSIVADGDPVSGIATNRPVQSLIDNSEYLLPIMMRNYTIHRIEGPSYAWDVSAIVEDQFGILNLLAKTRDGAEEDNLTIFRTQNGRDWVQITDFGGDVRVPTMFGMAYDPNRAESWVIVGGKRNDVGFFPEVWSADSPIGPWTRRTDGLEAATHLFDVAGTLYSVGGTFVAVGCFDAAPNFAPYITVSQNGATWETAPHGIASNGSRLLSVVRGVVDGNPIMVAVGQSTTGTGKIVMSSDLGFTWNEQTIPVSPTPAGNFHKVAWNGRYFFTLNENGPLRSPDGASWSYTAWEDTIGFVQAAGIVADPTTGVLIATQQGTSSIFWVSYDDGDTFQSIGQIFDDELSGISLDGVNYSTHTISSAWGIFSGRLVAVANDPGGDAGDTRIAMTLRR